MKSAGETYKLRLIPSGILYKDTPCLLGCGVVVDPKVLLGEIDSLRERGIPCENLRIDPRAQVIMPWHIVLDGLSEKARGGADIGTTKCGIGPAYMDKVERCGLRIYDLIHPDVFAKKVPPVAQLKNKVITKVYDGEAVDVNKVIAEYTEYGKRLAKYVADVSVMAYNAIKEGKEVLFEGAQGALLDIDLGTYPYVTSSHPITGGFCTGTGIGPNMLEEIVGAAKAYTTRVGKGPFPTELFDKTGDTIRNSGNEFGTVTKRPRRTGWFDAVILRHAVRINGLTAVALNKLDTLSGLPTLKVCNAYELPDGSTISDFPPTLEELEKCKPVYTELPGFAGDLSKCKSYDELPENAKNYVVAIEKMIGCRIAMVGIGPDRVQNLER